MAAAEEEALPFCSLLFSQAHDGFAEQWVLWAGD